MRMNTSNNILKLTAKSAAATEVLILTQLTHKSAVWSALHEHLERTKSWQVKRYTAAILLTKESMGEVSPSFDEYCVRCNV